VFLATRHRWTRLASTPARQAGTRFTYLEVMEGWVYLGVGFIPTGFICSQAVTRPGSNWMIASRRGVERTISRSKDHSHIPLYTLPGQAISEWAKSVWSCCNVVTGAPPHVSGDYERLHVVSVGSTLRLVCPVIARPTPLVDWWFKDSQRIHDGWVRHRPVNNTTLSVRDIRLTDSGRYTCTATNGFGSSQATFLVHVYSLCYVPIPTVTDSQLKRVQSDVT